MRVGDLSSSLIFGTIAAAAGFFSSRARQLNLAPGTNRRERHVQGERERERWERDGERVILDHKGVCN